MDSLVHDSPDHLDDLIVASHDEDVFGTTLGRVFRGRVFALDDRPLPPILALKSTGYLPLIAARANRNFKILHGAGMPLRGCLSCGREKTDDLRCAPDCPLKRGISTLESPFKLSLVKPPESLLGVRASLPRSRLGMIVAMFMAQDVAIEMIRQSKHPQVIELDGLLPELAATITPMLKAMPAPLEEQGPQADVNEALLEHISAATEPQPEVSAPA